jgi:flagellar basal-body rod protein FlgB
VGLFESTKIPLLNKALDAYAIRQRVLASNIANITTVGYKSQNVSFEEHLAAANNGSVVPRARTQSRPLAHGAQHPAQVCGVDPKAKQTREEKPIGYNEMASGSNDVDIDREMTDLAKNQIQFKFGSRLLGETFKGIQKAIRGTLS